MSDRQAAWIMKLTHEEFYALAEERGVSTPSDEAIEVHKAEIDGHVGPVVMQQEREQLRRQLSRFLDDACEVANQIARSKAFAVPAEAKRSSKIRPGHRLRALLGAIGACATHFIKNCDSAQGAALRVSLMLNSSWFPPHTFGSALRSEISGRQHDAWRGHASVG